MVEITLRSLGFKPGYLKKFSNYNITCKTKFVELYKTDERGVYHFNHSYIDSVNNLIKSDTSSNYFITESVSETLCEFKNLSENINIDTKSEFLKNIHFQLEHCDDTTYCQLLKDYLNMPFNKSGFRSVSFKKISSKKKKVLLLGDSFVYGMSATPFYNSFADILLSRGYIIFNTGISGTDPAQYAAIAEKFVPILNPDIVIVNFCMNNDLMLFKREPKESEPHEHFVNNSFIESNPMGEYLDLDESIKFYNKLTLINKTNFASKFVITSLFYGILVDMNFIYHPTYTNYKKVREKSRNIDKALNTKEYLTRIQNVANQNNTILINAVIPDKPEKLNFNKEYNLYYIDTIALNIVFENDEYFYPKNLNLSDYEKNGGHYNNKGAVKYADFLDSLIINAQVK